MTIGKNGRDVNVTPGMQGFQERKQAEPAASNLTPDANSPVGACPDCGEDIVGHVGATILPGTACQHCKYRAPNLEVETEPTYDDEGRTFVYSFEDDASIRITDDDGDTVDLYRAGDVNWEANLGVFGLEDRGDQILAALDARADWEDEA